MCACVCDVTLGYIKNIFQIIFENSQVIKTKVYLNVKWNVMNKLVYEDFNLVVDKMKKYKS